ncbi:MAG: thermostable hemolysin [Phenylobacterium sp.]|uniref:thermostable hemolysin n=1 Tax=Phenylobacterium sp. TaxID=1871053 RepID=UPI001A495AFC|nr:thermostable hemolysin [Phenylobacterium sp.]MBL8555387.1 thermostable hemolysin [Phenylobacterium sp.]
MSEPARATSDGDNVLHLPLPAPRVVVVGRSHPDRHEIEAFASARFAAAYDARVTADHPMIAALRAPDGTLLASAGLRLAETGPLFLERYLDAAVEHEVERGLGVVAPRESIVEIGAFASTHPAWSLQLFEALPPWLAGVAGRRFAVATLRPELARALGRAGFGLRRLADADPERLGAEAAAWGSYYAGAPKVYAGRVTAGAALAGLRDRLRTKAMERQARRRTRACA